MLLCWWLFAGTWQAAWWYWVIVASGSLVTLVACHVPIVLFRYSRNLASVNTDSFRLASPNFWTETQHVKDGGAREMMLMEDGNFVMLSVGITTLKIFVTPTLSSADAFVEIAGFGLQNASDRPSMPREARRDQDEELLTNLRKTIGFPKSVAELRDTIDSDLAI